MYLLEYKMGPQGSCEIRSSNGIAASAWKDVVHFLTTVHSPDQVSTIQRNQRLRTGVYQIADVPAHAIIDDYNANMGGVDRNDQLNAILKSRKSFCSSFLGAFCVPMFKDSPQIVMLWWEWLKG